MRCSPRVGVVEGGIGAVGGGVDGVDEGIGVGGVCVRAAYEARIHHALRLVGQIHRVGPAGKWQQGRALHERS